MIMNNTRKMLYMLIYNILLVLLTVTGQSVLEYEPVPNCRDRLVIAAMVTVDI